MRRIETFQNILTSFCCIRIIIRQFLHISTPLVTSAKALSLPVTSLCSPSFHAERLCRSWVPQQLGCDCRLQLKSCNEPRATSTNGKHHGQKCRPNPCPFQKTSPRSLQLATRTCINDHKSIQVFSNTCNMM